MKTITKHASLGTPLLLTLVILPLSMLTGCCSGRLALSLGLHAQAKPDEAVMASVSTPPASVTPQRHARIEPAAIRLNSAGRSASAPVLFAAQTNAGAEDESFTPTDDRTASH